MPLPTSSVADDPGNSTQSFLRCVPNPFAQEVRIDYAIPTLARDRALEVSIYGVGGRLVRTLSPDKYPAWTFHADAGASGHRSPRRT
jgi:hypothetical protein